LHNTARFHYHYNIYSWQKDPLVDACGHLEQILSAIHKMFGIKCRKTAGFRPQVYQAHCKQLRTTVAVKKLDLDAPHCDLVSEYYSMINQYDHFLICFNFADLFQFVLKCVHTFLRTVTVTASHSHGWPASAATACLANAKLALGVEPRQKVS
jgi:hypothetical protein